MTLALPVWRDRISPLLDTAARLLVLTCRNGRETGRQVLVLPEQGPEDLALTLAGLKLDWLVCGALSEQLRRALQEQGVRLCPHRCGSVDSILQAICRGRLDRKEFQIPGCCPPLGSRSTPHAKSRTHPPSRTRKKTASTPRRTPSGAVQ